MTQTSGPGGGCPFLGTETKTGSTDGKVVNNFEYNIVVTTFDGTTERIYLNGVLDKQAAMTTSTPVNSANRIAIGYVRNTGLDRMVDADVGAMIIYAKALSASEVVNVYNFYRARYTIYKLFITLEKIMILFFFIIFTLDLPYP